jgi:tetratricopeptide (TPR) repeat protein
VFTWIDPLAINLGYSEALVPRETELRLCDPMSASSWWSEIRALLWAGQPEQALETATQAVEVVQHDWVYLGLVMSLAAVGRFDQADIEIDTRFQSEPNALLARVLNAALRGDREAADEWYPQAMEKFNQSRYFGLMASAWRGDRTEANRLAAEIDPKPFGPMALTVIGWWCNCGGPWELDATPNFARMVGETGHSWPPPPGLNFPLKDW